MKALRALEQALLARTGGREDDRLLVRLHLALSMAHFELDGRAVAEVWLERAATDARRLDDPDLLALCHSQRASVLGRSGEVRQALEEIERAVELGADLEPRDQVVLLLNHGTTLMLLGQLAPAAERLSRARDAALAAGLRLEASMSRCNEGYARYLTGDLPWALALLSEAEADASGVTSWVVRLDRGRILMEAGLLSEARDTLLEASALCRRHRQRRVMGEIELELAGLQGLLGRPREGRRLAVVARERFRRRGDELWTARADLVLNRLALAADMPPRHVLTTARRLTPHFIDQDPVLLAEHRLLIAEAASRTGDHAEVRRQLALVEPMARRLPVRGQLHVTHLRARLALADGDRGRARRQLTAAAGLLTRRQTGASSMDLRSALALHGVPLARLHIELEASRGCRAVFEASERWRAVTVEAQPVLPPPDETLAGQLSLLREVRGQLRQTPAGGARERLQSEQYRLERQVRARSWAGRRAGALLAGRTTYPRVRQLLVEQDRDLVSLLPHRGRVLAVTVVRGRGRLVELGSLAEVGEAATRVRADLDAASRHELGPFGEAVWASLRRGMRTVDELVLRPLRLGARPVVLVPHRDLSALPWALAPSLHAVPVVTSSSAGEWAARAVLPSTPGGRVPVARALAGPGLELADAEVAEVAGSWPGGVATPAAEARVEDLRSALVNADVVHVAAHGRHQQENPMFASVELTGGPLFVYDLEHTGVGARHVVLSSCELGRAQVRPGDEPIGLAAGLLRLGAVSVVAGVCRVPDTVSASVMAAYHKAVAGGTATDEALATVVDQQGGLAAAFGVYGASWSGRGAPGRGAPRTQNCTRDGDPYWGTH